VRPKFPMLNYFWSFPSFSNRTSLFPEAEAWREFRLLCLYHIIDPGLVREQEIVEHISSGVVEEGGNTEESLGHEIYSLSEHFKLQVVSQVDCGEVGDGENHYHSVPYAHIAPYSHIFEVIALFDIPKRFVTLPAGKIDFHNMPYAFLGSLLYRAACRKPHWLFSEPLRHDEKQGIGPPRKFDGNGII
jgi:hypothetical protein